MKKKVKRRFFIFILFVIFFIFVWFFSTFVPEVTHTEIYSKKIKNEIKIVQISDLHGMKFGVGNNILIKKIEAENPDIIAVTGDMFTFHDEKGKETAVSLITDLAKKYKVYFVNGEHDNDEDFMDTLSENGVDVLSYKDEIISVGETKLHFYGITNVYYTSTFNLENAFTRDDELFTILLAHMENFEKFASFGIDLSLCGDTHGGIVRLPYVGSIYDGEEWFPELNGKYIKGLYSFGDSLMYISSGLGNYPVSFRFCNRPEMAVIKLLPEN